MKYTHKNNETKKIKIKTKEQNMKKTTKQQENKVKIEKNIYIFQN